MILLPGCICLLATSSAVSTHTIYLHKTNGVLTVCPGDFLNITCIHDDAVGQFSRWEFSNYLGSCIIAHDGTPPPACGSFTISMVSVYDGSATTASSTAQATATLSLDGTMVACRAGGISSDPLVGSITINVDGIPKPNISSVMQVSQSVVRVSLSVADSQCVDSYQVEATPVGGSGSISTSSTSAVDVTGLNVCQYNYNFVGSVLTAGGVQSELSSPEIFSINLSVLRGITVMVNQVDPLIEWVQMDNPLYPTCITEYFIDGGAGLGLNTTVDSTTRSFTARQLNAAGFPYCIRIQPTVTPITPMGSLVTLQGSGDVHTNLIDPDFPTPMLTSSLTLSNETVTLRITTQNVSEATIPIRNYQYTLNSGTPSAVMSFTGDYFEIMLPGVKTELRISVAVTFQRLAICSEMTMANYTISRNITGLTQGQPTDTSQTITITLPLTEYQPEQLLIISTASAPGENDTTEMANFTSPSMRYTVTFTDLDPATEYTFTIRIVLRSNNTVDVIPTVIGAFTTAPMDTIQPSPTDPPTNPPQTPTEGCDGGCVAGIVIAIVVILIIVIVVVIAVVVFLFVIPKSQKANAKDPKQPGQQEVNTYETPESVKVELIVVDNEKTLQSSGGTKP